MRPVLKAEVHGELENSRVWGTPLFGLIVALTISAALKFAVLNVGAPFITIDDLTSFEGGFLVWFGNAPPQHTYLESWIYGVCSLCVYAFRSLSGIVSSGIGINLVADAYRDFYGQPEPYVASYRVLTIAADLGTAVLAYLVACRALKDAWRGWAAVLVAVLYLFSFNTIWCDIVARPDAFVALFSVLGLWLYLKSEAGRYGSWLLLSAVALGAAAGLKLHGAFVTIFLCIDLLRVHGWERGIRKAALLASVASLFFCVTAGSLLFDPLTYVKLRWANARDDVAPWLQWGDQFITILRGTGWVALPLSLVGSWLAFRPGVATDRREIQSCVVLAVSWLLLFAMIRQMRAYWMLPALLPIYVAAVYCVTRIPGRLVRISVVTAVVSVFVLQSLSQVRDLRTARYDELRNWVTSNIGGEPFYVVGYDALILPKNTRCLTRTATTMQLGMDRARRQGDSFTVRHVRHWEERSMLRLFDMLGGQFEPGYEFYNYLATPPEALREVLDFREIRYVLVQQEFRLDMVPEIERAGAPLEQVAELVGAGGGREGLRYKVYRRQ